MLRKDLSDLPSTTKTEGLTPDDDNTFVVPLVEELAAQPRKPQVADTLTRHSSAGNCLYRIALLRDGVEPEPMDLAGHHVTNIGTLIHDAWQAALGRKHGDAVSFEIGSTIEDLTSGSCDALIHGDPDDVHVLELKTVSDFGFDKAIGLKGTAEGPKPDHLTQLALNVRGHDADKGTIIYMRRSSISAPQAERFGLDDVERFGAQWTVPRETLDPIADEWLEQLAWVRDHDTEDVPRFVPNVTPRGARLDPTTGTWTLRDGDDVIDTGTYWNKGAGCLAYCPVRDACVDRFLDGK